MRRLLMKALDVDAALPKIVTEIVKKEFTVADVHTLFGAIGIAEAETGDNYAALKRKLYKLFPEVKAAHDETNRKWKQIGQSQARARKSIAAKLARSLDRKLPIIPQIEKWVEDNYPSLRDNYSDETCIAADLYTHHPSLVPDLARELRVAAEKSNDSYYMEKQNSETWYYLVRLLERKALWQKYVKAANGKLVPRRQPPSPTPAR